MMCHDWGWLCHAGVPETGRLPAGTGRGAAQQSQASMADAPGIRGTIPWDHNALHCEHMENMLQGRQNVAAVWLY